MDRLTLNARQRGRLQRQLRQAQDARVHRRVLAVLELGSGRAIGDVAAMLGVSRQSVYNWVQRFRRQEPSGRAKRKPRRPSEATPTVWEDAPRGGRRSCWDERARRRLTELLRGTPRQFGGVAVGWTVRLLREELQKHCGRAFGDDTVRRELQRRKYEWKRPRYVLVPDPEREKKTPDSSANSRLASVVAAKRGLGGRRDGPAVVSPAASGLVAAR